MMASFRSPRFFLSLSLSILKRAWRSREREIERREEETKLVRTLARVVASSRVEVRGKKEFCERESRETVTPSRVFMLALSLSRLDNQAKNFSARKKKTFHRRARVFLFFPAHHAARPTGDGARRQRRAGLVLLLLLGEARAPSPQQRRRPATTVRFVPAHRPRRQRHRGGVQGRRNRRGRLRRQHRRLLHDRQGGRWMEREAEREREKKKRKRATETTLESISPRGKRAPLLRAFRVSEAFFSL